MSDTSLNSVSSEDSTDSSMSDNRRDSKPTLVYTKDFLLNLQFCPSSLVKPAKLPNLSIVCDEVCDKRLSSNVIIVD